MIDQLIQYIGTHIDEVLTLDSLASKFAVPKYQLHRQFKRRVGFTLAKFIEQTRLNAAVDKLMLHDASVTTIAFECGYQNPETFTRAFRRKFGVSPLEFRSHGTWSNQAFSVSRSYSVNQAWSLSKSRAQKLNPISLRKIRFVGRYEEVPAELWQNLAIELTSQGISFEHSVGIGYDPDDGSKNLRFDAGLTVQSNPINTAQTTLPGGWFACCTYIGPLGLLSAAYGKIYEQAAALENSHLVGLPVIEIYRQSLVHADDFGLNESTRRTDIYVPIELQS